jgi:hypothetical protein
MNPHFETKIISHHQIRQCIHDLHANGGEFGLFVLIGDCPDSYQTIKRCALQEFGIITLCCDMGSIRKQNNPGKLVSTFLLVDYLKFILSECIYRKCRSKNERTFRWYKFKCII